MPKKTCFDLDEVTVKKSGDRLSVYGIGLKRAIFKMGNVIDIVSNHPETGFSLHINVDEWSREEDEPWKFKNLTPYKSGKSYGTSIRFPSCRMT